MKAERAGQPPAPAQRGERLLVVDDDPDVRDSLKRALRCAGYAVTTAVHGADALDALTRAPVDLIVLDVLMPMVDGFDACRRLRARGDSTPILVLTARDAVDDRVAGAAAPAPPADAAHPVHPGRGGRGRRGHAGGDRGGLPGAPLRPAGSGAAAAAAAERGGVPGGRALPRAHPGRMGPAALGPVRGIQPVRAGRDGPRYRLGAAG